MTATQPQLDMLRAVNSQWNETPYDSVPKAGEAADTWIDAPDGGEWECRDYVVAKANALRNMGVAPEEMSVVLCWTEPVKAPPDPPTGQPSDTREYHAVLACDAGGEGFILDSRADDIYLWSDPPFDYLWWYQQTPDTVDFSDACRTAGLSFA